MPPHPGWLPWVWTAAAGAARKDVQQAGRAPIGCPSTPLKASLRPYSGEGTQSDGAFPVPRALQSGPTRCASQPAGAESARRLAGASHEGSSPDGVRRIHAGIINIVGIFLFSSSTCEIYKIKLIY